VLDKLEVDAILPLLSPGTRDPALLVSLDTRLRSTPMVSGDLFPAVELATTVASTPSAPALLLPVRSLNLVLPTSASEPSTLWLMARLVLFPSPLRASPS